MPLWNAFESSINQIANQYENPCNSPARLPALIPSIHDKKEAYQLKDILRSKQNYSSYY